MYFKTFQRSARHAIVAALFAVIAGCNNEGSTKSQTDADSKVASKGNYDYEILKQEDSGSGEMSFQNFSILLKATDKSKENVKKCALELKANLCKGRCNIILYDDASAYAFENEFNEAEAYLGSKLSNGEITKKQYKAQYLSVEKKYYVKIADHLIGSIFIDSDEFDYYPDRDFRYKELGGKK